MSWLERSADGAVVLTLHVQPNARKTEFCGLHGDALKIRLAAPPVDGKANQALIEFLADFCGTGRSSVRLVSGQSGRSKRIRIDGASAELVARLAALTTSS